MVSAAATTGKMPNPRIAQLIAQHLPAGIPHPGDPDNHQPPVMVPLPAFRTAGMPEDMAERVNNTARLISEGIVHLMETAGQSEIVPRAELAELRVAEVPDGQPTPILCSSCRKPLFSENLTSGPAYA